IRSLTGMHVLRVPLKKGAHRAGMVTNHSQLHPGFCECVASEFFCGVFATLSRIIDQMQRMLAGDSHAPRERWMPVQPDPGTTAGRGSAKGSNTVPRLRLRRSERGLAKRR